MLTLFSSTPILPSGTRGGGRQDSQTRCSAIETTLAVRIQAALRVQASALCLPFGGEGGGLTVDELDLARLALVLRHAADLDFLAHERILRASPPSPTAPSSPTSTTTKAPAAEAAAVAAIAPITRVLDTHI